MKGLILNEGGYVTYPFQVFEKIESFIRKLNWRVSNVICCGDDTFKFFLEPTVAFVQDGTRNTKIEADREKYSNQIKDIFDKAGLNYICLSGDYLSRYEKVKEIIFKEFGI